MIGSRYLVGLVWRLGLLILAALAFAETLARPDLGATRIVAALVVIGSGALLWRHVTRTNRELARFIDAVRFADFSQGFIHRSEGSGFSELGRVLDGAMKRLRDDKHKLIDANRFYEAVLDDAPTALLTVDGEGRVELANKAARRLLVRHKGVRVEDFRDYGDAFARALEGGAIGRPRLVPLVSDGVPQTMLVSGAVVHRLGGLVRVVAVQPIQGELNAIEIAAQSDLIRVLTHEIMNSMTPVTSLAHSAAALMRAADKGADRDVADARGAVETLARRADGVMHFVESYRQISRAPEIRRRAIDVAAWADELAALFRASDRAEGVTLDLAVDAGMALEADPDLMSQVLINLLRNAADAARDHAEAPQVRLAFQRARSGRAQIEVADNGPGVPENLKQDVFLPFFTTKAKGSGIGLSLARQVVLAHRGVISLETAPEGGALFRILL
ncbi:sensor histidine kinase [Sphingosinicella ginsenosidimutans]|uniref:histidine kinase n=1 Tax=Allosphingosinicella ginsenosidimutans TaxID=1176539 RepID=A0A5C6TS78_9SPHN|nr:ATP-binding protein [Sphingosinicella ginsenosidimutans]TXC63197.1 PAS domain-containing protein [Sphingosinicella ginsenosidimutans]